PRRPAACREARSQSWPAITTPGARQEPRARPAWHPYGRTIVLPGRMGGGVAKEDAGNRESRVARISDAVISISGRRSRGSESMVPRAYPRASRRRGLGEDSTAGTAAARRLERE